MRAAFFLWGGQTRVFCLIEKTFPKMATRRTLNRLWVLSVMGIFRQSSQQVFDFYREAIRESRRTTQQQ